jgi:hypothetical protein
VKIFTTFYGMNVSPIVESGKMFGWEVDTFGTDEKFVSFYETKVLGQIRYLEKTNNQLVMFVDGSDAFVVCGPDEVEALWNNSWRGRVVVGADRMPWPYPWMRSVFAKYYKAPSVCKYPEPGIILGMSSDVLEYLNKIRDGFDSWRSQLLLTPWGTYASTPEKIIRDDMGLWALAIRDGLIDPVLDVGCLLSTAMKGVRTETIQSVDGRPVNPITRSRSAIWHCNGSKKLCVLSLEDLYSRLLGVAWGHGKQKTL